MPRILIVDDETVVRESLQSWFDNEGYETEAAGGGREALLAIQKRRYDLALLDIKISGPEKPVYVSQPVRYQIVVHNQGSIPMDNVAVAVNLPKNVKVKQASQGAEHFPNEDVYNAADSPHS